MFEYERERAGGQVLLFSFASNKDTVVFHKMGKKGVAMLGLILMAIKQRFMFLI